MSDGALHRVQATHLVACRLRRTFKIMPRVQAKCTLEQALHEFTCEVRPMSRCADCPCPGTHIILLQAVQHLGISLAAHTDR